MEVYKRPYEVENAADETFCTMRWQSCGPEAGSKAGYSCWWRMSRPS